MTSQHQLSAAILSAEPILRLLLNATEAMTAGEIAKALGKDASNIRKDTKAYAEADLLASHMAGQANVYALAQGGRDALAALDRAGGQGGDAQVWPHGQIVRNPANVRKTFPAEKIAEIAESIVEVGGLLHNLVLRPADASGVRMIHDGECRWRACDLLIGQDRLPASLAEGLPFTEREGTEEEALFVALIANAQRGDLSPWEDAQGLKAYKDLAGLSARAVAFRLGRALPGSEKGVKDVQEKIKTAEEATAANIALHESGLWTWEQLRESVRVAKAPTATEPAPEPNQVELENAIAATKAPAADDALDPDLVVAVLEIAHRAHRYPSAPSPLGKTTEITTWISPTARAHQYPLAAQLAAYGLAAFGTQHPYTAILLRPAEILVAGLADPDGTIDAALRTARRAAGIDEADIDDLEREGKYQIDWLNKPAPPKPTEISDADALVLLEIYDAWKRQGGTTYGSGPNYYGIPVQRDLDRAVVDGLVSQGLVKAHLEKALADGTVRIEPSVYGRPNAAEALAGRWEGLEKAGERTKALFEIREKVLGAVEAEACKKDKRYATAWLNGPFEIPADVQAKIDEDAKRAAQSERDQAKAAARKKAAEDEAERKFFELVAAAPSMSLADLGKKMTAMLESRQQLTPYVKDNGYWGWAKMEGRGLGPDSFGARMAVVAINALTGRWPEVAEEQVTVIVFERWIAEKLTADYGIENSSVAADQAGLALKRFLDDAGAAFGDEYCEWARDDADDIASDWAQDFIEDGQVVRAALATDPIEAQVQR